MEFRAALAQAALAEQDERRQRENQVAEAIGVGRVRSSRGRLLDTIPIGDDADIAVISQRTSGGDPATVYQAVIEQRTAATRVHASLDLALLHLVEIRAAHARGSYGPHLDSREYGYAARVLRIPEED